MSTEGDMVSVVVPIYRSAPLARRAVERILATIPDQVPVILIDDASADPEVDVLLSPESLADFGPRPIRVIRNTRNLGYPGSVNEAIRAAGATDVVVVNSDVVVAPGWLEELMRAAAALPRAATLSVLSNNGTMLSVPFRNDPRPDFPILDSLEDLSRATAGLRPTEVSNSIGHVLYLTRAAIDAVGLLDERYYPGYGEEVDFSLRAAEAGFVNYVVPGVAVHHEGSGSFGHEREAHVRRNSRLVQGRYPYVWVRAGEYETNESTALAGILATASASLRPVVAHLLGVPSKQAGHRFGQEGAVRWTSDPRSAEVVLVPISAEVPESLPINRRQRVVVLFERTELITRQWMHSDAGAWASWMARVRTLCLSADAVLAREPAVVVDSGLASELRVHQLTPVKDWGAPSTIANSPRTLLLGPVDSAAFQAASSAKAAELEKACIVGQPVPETWTRPAFEPGMRDGLGMSSVPGYRGRRPLDDLRSEAGWPREALVWAPILHEAIWAVGGIPEPGLLPTPLWQTLQFSEEAANKPAPNLADIDEHLLCAMRGPMNPVRALVPTSSARDTLFLDPPTPRVEMAPIPDRTRRKLRPKSILNSLRYEGLGGSLRKIGRRNPTGA